MLYVFFVAFSLLLILVLIGLIVSPLAALFLAAKDPEVPANSKPMWLIAIFIAGPFASCFYFFWYGKSAWSRIAHMVLLGACAILMIVALYARKHPLTDSQAEQLIQKLIGIDPEAE